MKAEKELKKQKIEEINKLIEKNMKIRKVDWKKLDAIAKKIRPSVIKAEKIRMQAERERLLKILLNEQITLTL